LKAQVDSERHRSHRTNFIWGGKRMKSLVGVCLGIGGVLGVFAFKGDQELASQASGREVLPLQLEEQIPVPSVAGRIDHFSADAKRKRLFVSALGNNTVEVLDVFAGKVMHTIKGLARPQGTHGDPRTVDRTSDDCGRKNTQAGSSAADVSQKRWEC
jgi:hypothetical protein